MIVVTPRLMVKCPMFVERPLLKNRHVRLVRSKFVALRVIT
jgi:hypothetical protein